MKKILAVSLLTSLLCGGCALFGGDEGSSPATAAPAEEAATETAKAPEKAPAKAAPVSQSKLEAEMLNLCKQLPEYETVMAMYGVGKSTGPHLMAELGDVRRFLHRSSIVAFAGVDPGVVGSGKMQLSSVTTSKRGSPQLRKALFQVVSTYVKCKPENEAVYQFYTKKRDEGKPFFVCTTAAANKFLRIYYARVKECLNAAESATQVEEG